jgi:hypothetical protein
VLCCGRRSWLRDITDACLPPLPAAAADTGAFVVCCDTYVTDDSGTGIVHQAPAYGEDDFRVCLNHGVLQKGEAPPDAVPMRMASNDLWLLGRVLVDGAADVPAVHALQDAMRLEAPAVSRPWRAVPAERDARAFLAFAAEALGRSPVPARDAALLDRIAGVGLVPGEADPWSRLDEPTREAWTRLMPELRRRLRPGDPSRRSVVESMSRRRWSMRGWPMVRGSTRSFHRWRCAGRRSPSGVLPAASRVRKT